jgi:hypothetical protein
MSAGDALRNATIADVVVHVVIRRRTVLTRHDHSEGLLGTRGRGTQKGQVTRVAEVVVRIVIWLVQGSRGLIAWWRRWDVEIGNAEGLARCEGDKRWLLLLRLLQNVWVGGWGWREHVKRIRGCSVGFRVIWRG